MGQLILKYPWEYHGRVEMGFTMLMKFAEALEVSVIDLLYPEEEK